MRLVLCAFSIHRHFSHCACFDLLLCVLPVWFSRAPALLPLLASLSFQLLLRVPPDINEAPVVSPVLVNVQENRASGTILAPRFNTTDPDNGDFPTFAVVQAYGTLDRVTVVSVCALCECSGWLFAPASKARKTLRLMVPSHPTVYLVPNA